jgi:hypothetical protein
VSIELLKECKRQVENCETTVAGMFAVVKRLSFWRLWMSASGVVFGAFSGISLLEAQAIQAWIIVASLSAFLAGLMPTLIKALGLDEGIADARACAGEFTNLRNRFRYAANVYSELFLEELKRETDPYFDRLELVNERAVSVPEWAFKRAVQKREEGDYQNRVDQD